jgi:hypothetical protein
MSGHANENTTYVGKLKPQPFVFLTGPDRDGREQYRRRWEAECSTPLVTFWGLGVYHHTELEDRIRAAVKIADAGIHAVALISEDDWVFSFMRLLHHEGTHNIMVVFFNKGSYEEVSLEGDDELNWPELLCPCGMYMEMRIRWEQMGEEKRKGLESPYEIEKRINGAHDDRKGE